MNLGAQIEALQIGGDLGLAPGRPLGEEALDLVGGHEADQL
jgi:hypothetical protein